MDTKKAFAKALKQTRTARGLTQEDFAMVSSRTYLSMLERGLKSPTLEKINALAATLRVHPLTLLTLTYLYAKRGQSPEGLVEAVLSEIGEITAKKSDLEA